MDAGNRRKEDSGLIDIDALMRQANEVAESAAVSPATPVAPQEKKKEEKRKATLIAPPKNEPPKSEVSLESTPALVTPIPRAPRVPEQLAVPAAAPRQPAKARSFKRPFVAASLALALLGGGALYSQLRATPAAKPAPVAVVAPREPAAAAPRPLETAQSSLPSAIDLPSVPAESASAAIAPTASTVALVKHAAPAKVVDAVVTTTELIPESPAQGNDLGSAMHAAVGDGSSRVAKVEGTRNNDARTLRPSPGAVIGALNAVLPAARECLGPDDAIRVGTVTFRSDGAVAKVELNGTRESDGCIRSAVSRARVEPFADDTFTTRVTVRP